MAVTCDPEHKFELAVQLSDLKTAYQLAKEMEVTHNFQFNLSSFLYLAIAVSFSILTAISNVDFS